MAYVRFGLNMAVPGIPIFGIIILQKLVDINKIVLHSLCALLDIDRDLCIPE